MYFYRALLTILYLISKKNKYGNAKQHDVSTVCAPLSGGVQQADL
jgi:hypothetical protein